jgi:uncharacterized membrane protein YqhA
MGAMSESENADKRISLWKRIMASTRYVMGLAVLGIFVGSSALLISGSIDMFTAVVRALSGTADYSEGLRVTLIEAVDTVLVSTVLYMIAIGLYQLFIDPSLVLPPWIHTRGLGDLEKRLSGMVVTVLSVIFVTVALESHGTKDILPFGLAIAGVIAAISLFLYVEAKHHPEHDSGKE